MSDETRVLYEGKPLKMRFSESFLGDLEKPDPFRPGEGRMWVEKLELQIRGDEGIIVFHAGEAPS